MSIINLTKENFETEVNNQEKVVLIDFWAEWCAPCRMFSPIIDQVAEEVGSDIKVCKVNIDQQQELAQKFSVMSIPTLIIIKDGKVVDQSVGVIPKPKILSMLKK